MRSFFGKIAAFWGWCTGSLKTYLAALESDGRVRFLSFAWASALSFVGFLLLANFNPLYLLLPGALFPAPRADIRVALPVATFTQSGKPVLVNRYIHPDYELEDRLLLMAHFISQLPTPGEYPANLPDLMPMPHLGLAIRNIWKSGGGIVVDFRSPTIEAELDVFMKSHANRKKEDVLRAWFSAFTAGALEKQSVQFVEYLLDGQKKDIDIPDFDLERRFVRP